MGILDDAIKEHLELKRAHGAPEDLIKEKEAEAFGPVRQGAAPAPAEAPGADVDEVDPETALYEDAATEYEPVAPPEPVAATEALVEPQPEPAPPEPVAEDPYAVHPGDEPVPDPHAHDEPPMGSDPAYREETEIFAEAPAPPPPVHHPEEPHPALHEHDHLRGEEHAPEPVFRAEPEPAPPAPEPAAPAPEPELASDPVPEPEPAPEPQPEPEPETAPAATAPIPDTEADVELAEEDVLEETPEFLQDAPEHDRLWFEQRPPRDFDFGE
jgi:hypothetical protein